MAKITSRLSSIPDAYGILFIRLILLTLSIAAVAVYAKAISDYNTRVAPTGALLPSPATPLIVDGVCLIPSVFSSLWSITHLSLLTRRLLHPQHQRESGEGEGCVGRSGRVPLVHPGVVLGLDAFCWAFFLAMAIVSGIESTQWKRGRVPVYGFEVTRQVDLGACPTYDSATGRIDYWCEGGWNDVVNMTNHGTSLLGTLTGVHFGRIVFACFELYLLHRYGSLERSHRKRSVDDESTTATGPPPLPAQEIELNQK